MTFQSELDQKIISNNLRGEFENNNNELSQNAIAAIEELGNRWQIRDGSREFVIKKDGDRLNVYEETWSSNQAGMWLSPYAEGDQPPADIRWPSMVIGGLGIRLVPGAKPEPAQINNSGFLVTFPYGARAENREGTNIVEGVLGSPNVGNVAFEFKSDGDTGKEVLGERQSGGPYRLQFDPDDKRWWLAYASSPNWCPIGFTTNSSVERGTPTLNNSYPILPRGYYLGDSVGGQWIKVSVGSSDPPDPRIPGKLGDRVYNTNPSSGGYVGWVYTANGWKPFGKIELVCSRKA